MTTPSATPFSRARADAAGWTLEVVTEVDSTNRIASKLPPWRAVRAEIQTAGRGRTGRAWISDRGGLWLSAALPCPGPRERWATLPLAAGHSLHNALAGLGVSDLRLRWPNDLLVGRRKLAGLLVERHSPETAVVGVGLNVFNSPEEASPDLRSSTARLADLVALGERDLDNVASLVLRALTDAHALLAANRFTSIVDGLNRAWSASPARQVALTLNGRPEPLVAQFLGIDDDGRLLVSMEDRTEALDATRVALLREL
ncbi:MAG: hypothetical protein RLZZ50_1929 [Verrucomicrobiota bacterium]|jgi:BirA family biotin operon repressor/biotin-[acetyl-CoA-carboxylase] ligase